LYFAHRGRDDSSRSALRPFAQPIEVAVNDRRRVERNRLTKNTAWLPREIKRDTKGFILTGTAVAQSPEWHKMSRLPEPLETSRPGVFAPGDVRSGSVKRCAAAVGEGGTAIENVHRSLAVYAIR
jgi:thioredoxin reductase